MNKLQRIEINNELSVHQKQMEHQLNLLLKNQAGNHGEIIGSLMILYNQNNDLYKKQNDDLLERSEQLDQKLKIIVQECE